MSNQNDDLAYGQYYDSSRGSGDTSRGLSDTFKKLKDTYKAHQSSSQPGQPGGYQGDPSQRPPQSSPYGYSSQTPDPQYQQLQYQQSQYQQNPQYQQGKPPKEDKLAGFLNKIQGTVAEFGSEFATKIGTTIDPQAYAEYGPHKPNTRFGSFAPPREHNDVKWYVDGCSYFWAVSRALENARESIWILDWWLSPELYLRRPPAKNEQFRLDRMLQAAAQRGVRINIIVYKEVTQALTLSSSHTKHALENLHPNIAVFRHPDHLPNPGDITADITSTLEHLTLDSASLTKMPKDTLKGLYGTHDDAILYWAHHEKLCIIDGQIAFMGGLDLCFGRWDTNQHAIADVHPSDLTETVFPGQDYNNSRVLDFHDVSHWENNKLDRKVSSRMGWSDLSVSLHGPVVEDLRRHFVERWNFIYDAKYRTRNQPRYAKLALYGATNIFQCPHPQQPPSQPNQPSWQAPSHTPNTTQQQPPSWQAPSHTSTPAPQQQPSTVPSYLLASQGTGTGSSTYPPAPGQTPSPSQPQQNAAPSWQPDSSYQSSYNQKHDSAAPPSYDRPPPNQSTKPSSYEPSYQPASYPPAPAPGAGSPAHQSPAQNQAPYYPPPPPAPGALNELHGQSQGQAPYFPPPPGQDAQHSSTRGLEEPQYESERGFIPSGLSKAGSSWRGQLAGQIHQYQDKLTAYARPNSQGWGHMNCQVVRSAAKWSNGSPLEHSIADAYAAIIQNSQHFVYIENQFFITSTGDHQHPVKNKIGAAIVERILRAARAGQKYKIVVVIPSVPCFAGDLRDDEMLGTRAIMEFQYNSINRGGNSIMELVAKEGFNPMDYIRFYNLRNYDRIHNNNTMAAAEQYGGVNYNTAAEQYDQNVAGVGQPATAQRPAFDTTAPFQQYQQAAHHDPANKAAGAGHWDSVSSCYMLGGEDIRNVPWDGHPDAEIDAFVSEELYVHSKVMIADDRIALIGSANLNDRSQLGDHDSEIALIVEDFTPVHSTMNGNPFTVSRFASSLRRQLFRKHLGLLPPQDYQRPDANFEPVGVPNSFDFDSPESRIVADPLSDTVQSLWNSRAHTNTEVFRKVFRAVPDDTVRSWDSYKEFYEYYFHRADKEAEGNQGFGRPARYQWGHIVRDDFAPGPEGAKQVKELLSQVKGTLVEMPLMFLIEEDIAKTGLTLNEITEPIYT
ncbi:hypothetical protein N7468_003871 [Penicillium chermesinum]|uniref:phospholipase D n=1 Tax=Penicillium chermesinum TaxID=63820 RepID=A0A9W9P7K0_9EURO|nr:uncharacterized protein N7468_003871 [Penicillium chermesinum]KAJ5239252.1 hypothetical protein N7468_003871 [Penicillium chermesinum]